MRRVLKVLSLFLGLLLAAGAANAVLIGQQVVGNEYSAVLQVAGFSADLTVTFEDVSGLSPASLGVSVSLINPFDLGLLTRLPLDPSVTLPVGFLLLLEIDPPSGGGLSMRGVATVSLYTHNLDFLPGGVLRLYSASLGGDFRDITASAGGGSFRVGGVEPDFNQRQWLVLADLRPSNAVVDDKLQYLESTLAQTSEGIGALALAELEGLLGQVASEVENEDLDAARAALASFTGAVETYSGSQIPDQWSASGELTNVAGQLRSIAATLGFSLDEAGW